MAKITKVLCDRCKKEVSGDAGMCTVNVDITDLKGDAILSAKMEVCATCLEQVTKIIKQRVTLEQKVKRTKRAAPSA